MGNSAPEEERNQFQLILQSLDVRKIQSVYDTVQVHITNLRLQGEDIYGLSEEVDWAIGQCGDCSPLDLQIAEQVESKVYIFSDFGIVLWWKNASHMHKRP